MCADWSYRACPVCGSTDTSRIFAESTIELAKLDSFAFASRKVPEYMHPRLVECTSCGLLYGNPVLPDDTLAQAYKAADFDSGVESRHASRTYAQAVQKALGTAPDLSAALDIGAGDGTFLEQLIALGFKNVVGVEPSTAPIEAAMPHIRPRIRHGLFDARDFRQSTFSLITCFQTMEHLPKPLETAREALSLLRPGGEFIVVVHNVAALSRRMMGRKSPIFDLEHLQLFSPATIRALFEAAGFTDISVRSIWNRYPLRYWMRLFPFPAWLKPKLIRAVERMGFAEWLIALPAGNLVCAGKRPELDHPGGTVIEEPARVEA